MSFWSLALRNLLRNRRRSLATLLAMVVGLTAILLFGGYRSNIVYGMQTGFVQQSGHLQVQRTGYFLDGSDSPASYGIGDYERIIAAIRADEVLAPMLTVVTPTLQLGGIAGNFSAGISRSVLVTGLVPDEHNRMTRWNDYRLTSYARPLALDGTAEDAVTVGEGVARKLGLCGLQGLAACHDDAPPASVRAQDGDLPADILALSAQEATESASPAGHNRIELLASSARGAPNVASLSVVETRNMGIKAVDDMYMAMHLAQAQRLVYGADAPAVTAILVQLRHTGQLPAARARLEALLAGDLADRDLEVLDFETLNPLYGQTNRFMDSMFGFMATLIGVIVLFTIGNTMGTAVMERTVEIGTLRAMGLRRSGIRAMFLREALLLGLIGSAAGLVVALIVAWLINGSGLTWTPPGYSYAYFILVRVWQDAPLLAGSLAGMIVVTLASAWWPAQRAARLEIVDALRHV